MIYNPGDDNGVQVFKYGNIDFPIHNRNLEVSENLPLGFSKKLNQNSLGRVESNYQTFSQSRILFDLEWQLVFDSQNLEDFLSLLAVSQLDTMVSLANSIRIYEPLPSNNHLLLEDNKIKDLFTGSYEEYSLFITEVGDITHYSPEINKLNIKGVGERI